MTSKIFLLLNSWSSQVYENFDSLSDNNKKDFLLFGDPNSNVNKFILDAALLYIRRTGRFSGSLFGYEVLNIFSVIFIIIIRNIHPKL